jgi:hypothetical protein
MPALVAALVSIAVCAEWSVTILVPKARTEASGAR